MTKFWHKTGISDRGPDKRQIFAAVRLSGVGHHYFLFWSCKRMILTLVLGSLSGIFFIVLAVVLSTDSPMIFFNIPGLILVVGGCFAALFAGYPGKEIKAAFTAVK